MLNFGDACKKRGGAWQGPTQHDKYDCLLQGEMINETGTMTGGGGKPRGGKICLGSAAPRALDTREAAAELAVVEGELAANTQVRLCIRALACAGRMLVDQEAGFAQALMHARDACGCPQAGPCEGQAG